MKIAAIYVRKSIQTGKGESIQSQIDMCRQYARDRGFTVKDSLIYFDEGYSGKNVNRPRFKQMLNDLNKNHFDLLLCYRLDRVSRSINDFTNLITLLNKYNVSFISIKEQFDTNTAMGKSMMYIASVFSELERETISERVKDNLHSLARSGRWLGGTCPTGFKSEVTSLSSKDLNKEYVYALSPINCEIELVRNLYDNFLILKKLSLLEQYCIKNNIKSKNNHHFTQTSLKQILINPVYSIADEYLYDYLYSNDFSISNKRIEFTGKLGVLLYNINEKSLISLGRHRGIVKSKDWVSVQKIIFKDNKLPSRQGTSSIGLSSGLIYCSICGNLMRVKYGRKTITGISYYYLCTFKEKNKDNCNSFNLKGKYTDNIIFQEMESLFKLEVFLFYFIEYISLDMEHANYTEKPVIYNITHELDLLNERLINLKSQLNYNINSSSHIYILQQIELIEDKIVIIEESLNENHSKQENLKILNEFLYSFEKMLYDFDLSFLTFSEKQLLINNLIISIDWNNRKIIINFI